MSMYEDFNAIKEEQALKNFLQSYSTEFDKILENGLVSGHPRCLLAQLILISFPHTILCLNSSPFGDTRDQKHIDQQVQELSPNHAYGHRDRHNETGNLHIWVERGREVRYWRGSSWSICQ